MTQSTSPQASVGPIDNANLLPNAGEVEGATMEWVLVGDSTLGESFYWKTATEEMSWC